MIRISVKPEGEMVPRGWDPSSEWALFHFRERLTANGGKFGDANGKMKELESVILSSQCNTRQDDQACHLREQGIMRERKKFILRSYLVLCLFILPVTLSS